MDTIDAIRTKIEVRQFSDKHVSGQVKADVLEAARMTGSSSNSQHWRFVLVQQKEGIELLADDSTTGGWVRGAQFAVIILTNPKVPGHLIDAGRAVQDMQLAAWNYGVGSGIFTGINRDRLRKDFAIPQELEPSAVVGFGYSQKKITGKKKKRKSFAELVYAEKVGNAFDPNSLIS